MKTFPGQAAIGRGFPCAVMALVVLCAFAAPRARGQEAVNFEMRSVADRPGPHTRPYLGLVAGADGKPESTLLVDPPLLDSTAIRYVGLDYDEEDHPYILITLTGDGTKRFEQITKDNFGKQLGFVIGGQLYSTPRIVETIHGGKIAISGTFSPREAANLVERLNAALPGKAIDR